MCGSKSRYKISEISSPSSLNNCPQVSHCEYASQPCSVQEGSFFDVFIVLACGQETTTVQVSLYPPSTVVMVITVVPLLTPVTSPVVSFTVAMEASSVVNHTALFEALPGITANEGVFFSPISTESISSIVTSVTAIVFSTTVTLPLCVAKYTLLKSELKTFSSLYDTVTGVLPSGASALIRNVSSAITPLLVLFGHKTSSQVMLNGLPVTGPKDVSAKSLMAALFNSNTEESYPI